MINLIDELSGHAVERYARFAQQLQSQADAQYRLNILDEDVRRRLKKVVLQMARDFLTDERDHLTGDVATISQASFDQAMEDLNFQATGAFRNDEFTEDASDYGLRLLACQAERDALSLYQHVCNQALRVSVYLRSGNFSAAGAVAAVLVEDGTKLNLRFVDRAGRQYKSSKHIRDVYRSTLVNVANEVCIDTVVTHGQNVVFVTHPDPAFKWSGARLGLNSSARADALYYDVREEIFHPSTNAILTAVEA